MRRTRRSTNENGSTRSTRTSSGDASDPKRRKPNVESNVGRRLISSEEFVENAFSLKPKTVVKTARVLKTKWVDVHLAANRKEHHTEDYDLERLIIRRAQIFTLSISFDDSVNSSYDKIFLQFITGAKPQQSKGTVVRLPVGLTDGFHSTSGDASNWSCSTLTVEDQSVTVTVTPPADCVIGKYRMVVETQSSDVTDEELSKDRYEHEEELYVLFNPWCQADTVYMENEEERNEYVLNERGRIWMSSVRNPRPRPWNFGQFEDPCLEAAISLLSKSNLCPTGMSSAVSVIRAIAALANSSDEDGGVLTGRWTQDYPATCTVPWAWNGSVAILTRYMETGKAVEFGQCWVFSGLVTTLLRSLGIPTRSVTNYVSAHDTDGSMTIDRHWTLDGEPVKWRDDSVWNFHVWNESWLRRPDLPLGYDGWQAHDSTPQELSQGLMRCGPAPLKAIKEGHVYLNYDIPFIFAEVNGDQVHWMVDDDGNMAVMDVEMGAIGKFISTKAVGSNDREDLTLHYKFAEGSEDERRVVKFANRFSNRRHIYNIPERKDVTFELLLPTDPIIGDDFTVSIRMKNSSAQTHDVDVSISAMASYYTGLPNQRIKGIKVTETLTGGEENEVTLDVSYAEYDGLLNCEAAIQVYGQCKVPTINQTSVKQASFFLNKPATLTIKMPERGVHKEPITVTLRFFNPLKKKLTNGIFNIEGSGLTKPQTIRERGSIGPEKEVVHEITVVPTRYGERELVVDFSSNELTGVSQSATVYIPYPE